MQVKQISHKLEVGHKFEGMIIHNLASSINALKNDRKSLPAHAPVSESIERENSYEKWN